jgi:hypothetical protein
MEARTLLGSLFIHTRIGLGGVAFSILGIGCSTGDFGAFGFGFLHGENLIVFWRINAIVGKF